MTPQAKRLMAGAAIVVLFLAVIFGWLVFFAPDFNKPIAIEGRPLLVQDGPLFTDDQIGFQFTPPPGWGMQARSTQSPTTEKEERMVVKYKRLVRGPNVAWLRVSVRTAPDDATPVDLLRGRKPRETEWKITKEVEEGLTIGGLPAARITFGGLMNPDSKGSRQCTAEVVAVRSGKYAIYFTGTFTTTDDESRKQFRAAVESAVFDKKQFAKQ